MSMSTHVVGYRPADKRWSEMKAVYDTCIRAKLAIPAEVDDFFDHEPPNDLGIEIEIGDAVQKWSDESREGYQVNVRKLPRDCDFIRFYNSW